MSETKPVIAENQEQKTEAERVQAHEQIIGGEEELDRVRGAGGEAPPGGAERLWLLHVLARLHLRQGL